MHLWNNLAVLLSPLRLMPSFFVFVHKTAGYSYRTSENLSEETRLLGLFRAHPSARLWRNSRGMVERICHVIPCERRRNGLRFPQVESHWESGVFVTSGGPTIVFVRATIQWKFASASPEKHSTARVLSVIEDQIIGRFAPCVCCSSTGRMLQIVMAAFMDWSLRDLLSTWRAIMAWSFPPHRTRTMIRASGTPFPEFYILFNTNGLDSRWKEPTGRLNERNYRYCVRLLVLLLVELCM